MKKIVIWKVIAHTWYDCEYHELKEKNKKIVRDWWEANQEAVRRLHEIL